MIEGRRSPRCVTVPSRVARTEASASTSTRRAGELGARRWRAATMRESIASSRSWSRWWRWSALVAANRMRSIRRVTRPLSQPVRPSRKAARISASASSSVGHRRRAGVERLQRIDQHDLAVEAGEVLAEERAHHRGLIGLVAPGHHRGERAVRDRAFAEIERREGQRRRAVEVAGHQEAARAAGSRGWSRRRGPRGGSR